jgi:hypothetical protein
MNAHANVCATALDVVSEDLAHADLSGMLWLILKANHPESNHRIGGHNGTSADLEEAVKGSVESKGSLFLAHDQSVGEVKLANRTSQRASEHPRLQRGDPGRAIDQGTPRCLIGIDVEMQLPLTHMIAGCRVLARTPLGEIIRKPEVLIESGTLEVVLHLKDIATGLLDVFEFGLFHISPLIRDDYFCFSFFSPSLFRFLLHLMCSGLLYTSTANTLKVVHIEAH